VTADQTQRCAVVIYAPRVEYQFDIIWNADGSPHGVVVDGVPYACIRRKRDVLLPTGGWIQELIWPLK
jgi:hypothetical protein